MAGYVTRNILAVQYTGGNSAEILAAVAVVTPYSGNVWAIASEAGGTLTLTETASWGGVGVWPILAAQWVVVALDAGIIDRLDPAVYQARYRQIGEGTV